MRVQIRNLEEGSSTAVNRSRGWVALMLILLALALPNGPAQAQVEADGEPQSHSENLNTVSNPLPSEPLETHSPGRVSTPEEMMAWIETICAQGVRRAGYPAASWVEGWIAERFREFGLEEVRLEPAETMAWISGDSSLEVQLNMDPSQRLLLPAFGVPYSKPTSGLEGELSLPLGDVTGRIAVNRVRLLEMPQSVMRLLATRHYDPEGEFDTLRQVLPFSSAILDVMEPSIEAGAIGFIGILDFPWETKDYFVPYDAKPRSIPGVWLSHGNGERLLELLGRGDCTAKLVAEAETPMVTTHNVVGTLPGATDDWMIFGSHHDGPFDGAVEDASGIAMVLAQARYWASLPRAQRPHSMMFLLQSGHLSGFPGAAAFVQNHEVMLGNVVAEIHLEHAARRAVGIDGRLVATDEPEVRWWFTSRSTILEDAVEDALIEHGLARSLILPPDGFPPGSPAPPTDGSRFHLAGVPIVNFLTAPMYLFDSQDTVDKIHVESLEPITRAVISITESLRGISPVEIRASVREPGTTRTKSL